MGGQVDFEWETGYEVWQGCYGFLSLGKEIIALFPPEWGALKRWRGGVKGKSRGRWDRR